MFCGAPKYSETLHFWRPPEKSPPLRAPQLHAGDKAGWPTLVTREMPQTKSGHRILSQSNFTLFPFAALPWKQDHKNWRHWPWSWSPNVAKNQASGGQIIDNQDMYLNLFCKTLLLVLIWPNSPSCDSVYKFTETIMQGLSHSGH